MTDIDAPTYIRANFRPDDRLAAILINKRTRSVIQRLSTAETMAAKDFQNWLKLQNVANRSDGYISMNALRPDSQGRRKDEIADIRHIYLDFDHNGDNAVKALLQRKDVPAPSYIVSTSPEKWQVSWIVEGFERDQAERLQRGLARDGGADPAATDASRVLRLPGYLNHKYAPPYLVRAEAHSKGRGSVLGPQDFPQYLDEIDRRIQTARPVHQPRSHGEITQSERDWAYAKRALARGESEEHVIAAIAAYRRGDKWHPDDYARRTVHRAGAVRDAERASVACRVSGQTRPAR